MSPFVRICVTRWVVACSSLPCRRVWRSTLASSCARPSVALRLGLSGVCSRFSSGAEISQFSGLAIEKSRRFIEHFEGLVAQPGSQQPQPMNLSAGEGTLRQGHRCIQPVRAFLQVAQPQPLEPGFDRVLVVIASQQQVLAQARFKQHCVLRGVGDQLVHLPSTGQPAQRSGLLFVVQLRMAGFFAGQDADQIELDCFASVGWSFSAHAEGLQTFGSVFTTTQMQLLLRSRLSLAAHSVLQQPGLRSLQALGIDATDSIINAAYCALIPMRRSVRDAIVGFTVIGGIVSFAAMAMWMRGVRLGSSHWTVTASFEDAGGLAERSPVTYRGILVGSVRSVTVTPEAVVAELDIDKGDLRLAQPVTATVASASLLGVMPRWPW